ncbi:MAG: hypothetical protein KDD58_14515, partial [Bdellovibrionales bacterium]|nr:hypothetical protein [Bdellovibrionales bacterium]
MINFKNKSTLDPQILDRVLNEVTNQGYSLVNNYLNEDEIVIFRDLVENAVNNFEVNNNPFRLKEKYHIHDLLLQSPYFLKIFEDLRLQQLVSIFLGKFWTMYAFTSSSVPPNGSNYARRVHNDCPRFIPNYITNIGI